MNHLAHCFLSNDDPQVLLGNFIGDFVKGRQWENYPEAVQRGILLHRRIDAFTDAHPDSLENVRLLRPVAGRYASPVLDILNDYLLFRNWKLYAQVPFESFAQWVFDNLDQQHALMPEPLHARWPHMRDGRFLFAYTTHDAMHRVLKNFISRNNIQSDADHLHAFFMENLIAFETGFLRFFPQLMQLVQHRP